MIVNPKFRKTTRDHQLSETLPFGVNRKNWRSCQFWATPKHKRFGKATITSMATIMRARWGINHLRLVSQMVTDQKTSFNSYLKSSRLDQLWTFNSSIMRTLSRIQEKIQPMQGAATYFPRVRSYWRHFFKQFETKLTGAGCSTEATTSAKFEFPIWCSQSVISSAFDEKVIHPTGLKVWWPFKQDPGSSSSRMMSGGGSVSRKWPGSSSDTCGRILSLMLTVSWNHKPGAAWLSFHFIYPKFGSSIHYFASFQFHLVV